MPVVPQYQPGQVQNRPLGQQRLNVRASAEDFGAAQARGLGAVAQGIGKVGDAFVAIRELEDVAAAKDADNRFAAWVRERSYGENGYMTMEGKAAVDARETFEREAAAKRQEFGAGLSGGAAANYKRASETRLNSVLDSSIVHAAQARKEWFKTASTDRIDTFTEDALAGFNNPSVVAKNIAAGQAELRAMGELQGWDADTLKNRETEFVSGVHKNIALRMAQTDPLAADAYRKKNASALTGPHQYDLEAALGSAVKEAEAVRVTDEIMRGGREAAPAAGAAKPIGMTGPTRARAVLAGKSVAGATRTDAIDGLDAGFATNLAAMLEDAPPGIREGLGLYSAFRSEDRQAELFADAVKKYGSPEAARKWVAPPGKSEHNSGTAVDLAWNGQSLKHAPKEVIDWVHANAGKYGMYFPMAHEPWHIEPQGSRDGSGTVAPRSAGMAPRAGMPSYDQIEAQLAGIADPQVRDLVRKRLNAQMEAQNKAVAAAETAAKAELWRVVEAGGTPDQVPQNIRVQAGMTAVSSAWGYIEDVAKRGAPKDDDVLTYNMRRFAAEKPDEFAKIDLNDYRGRLSKETFKEMTGLQTGALTDQRKTREENLTLTTAFGQADAALAGVGITTTGKEGTEREEAARRIAQFQNTLAAQMAEFKAANNKNPNQMEIQSMVNRLLLPVVVDEPGSLWGRNKVDMSGTGQDFLFDVGRIGNVGGGRTAAIAVDYEKIPTAQRTEIEIALEAQFGRKPSPDEVETAYAAYLTATVKPGN